MRTGERCQILSNADYDAQIDVYSLMGMLKGYDFDVSILAGKNIIQLTERGNSQVSMFLREGYLLESNTSSFISNIKSKKYSLTSSGREYLLSLYRSEPAYDYLGGDHVSR